MSLLQLPPETLAQIFDDIGSSFFREDLSRLTVCKQWFEFALSACFKSIRLSRKNLRSLIRSGITRSRPALKGSLEILDLELNGCYDYISDLYIRKYKQELNEWGEDPQEEVFREIWMGGLNNDLTQLAKMSQQSPRLHTLRIRVWEYSCPVDYLWPPTIRAFLSLENLSVLVLDLSVNFLDLSGVQGNVLHICPAISHLLHTLRTLHLRMRSIWPNVLKFEHPSDSLRLSVVAINLSLPATQWGTSRVHSFTCGHGAGRLLQLKADLQEQAEALITRMAHPRTIRILTHSLPLFETQSLDVLTGKTMMLDDNMTWDEDGREVQEDSEPESEISSLSDD
ncbi:hypothetical protein GGR55DRAFT_690101 [Xylaria sp. FL0064]|nr:hypothetical protein GGR55DRAFT_690101 [Xylaria sp. FL0064]